MPTYVYRRKDGTTFEVFQRISDDPLEVDPDTGEPVQRVIGGGAGLIFKGTGFYETDYVRKPRAADDAKSESKESKSESKTTNGDSGDSGDSSKATKKAASGDD